MAEAFRSLIELQLPGLVALCRADGRPLVLTADHGLSLVRGRLTHGGAKSAEYGGAKSPVRRRHLAGICAVWTPPSPAPKRPAQKRN